MLACGGGTGAPGAQARTASPSAAPVSAKPLAAHPADFGAVVMQECPAPETGDLAGFAAAYRTGIPAHDRLAAAAAAVAQAGPVDTWVVSLAANADAHPAWCKGSLGFAYGYEGQDKAPVATSFALVFKDEATARTVYAQVAPNLFAGGASAESAGFGANSTIRNNPSILWLVWQRGSRVAYLLCQDVDTCLAAAKAMDARLV